jgi:hypothetical protein
MSFRSPLPRSKSCDKRQPRRCEPKWEPKRPAQGRWSKSK